VRGILLAAAVSLAAPASAETIAVTGGMVAIGDGSQPIENGTVLFRDGRIVAAGSNVAVPSGARVLDAKGKWVSAGIVGAYSSLGIEDASGVGESRDVVARNSPFSAAIDVSTAINPNEPQIAIDRQGGVTRALVEPDTSRAIFAGQGAVIDLGGDKDALMRPRLFQYVELGEGGARAAGGSRPAAYAYLHAALAAARTPTAAGLVDRDVLLTRADAAALAPVLTGAQILLVHVERASDIRQVLSLKHDFPGIRIVLLGAAEGWMVADEIAAAHVPVIAAALADLPESFERVAATQSNVGRMTKAGVTVAISLIDATGGGAQQRYLTQFAGNLVALTKVPGMTGLDWGQAFASITSKPALAMGLDGEIGSLRPGRRADVVVWDGDPLELSSAPVAVFIDGIQQSLTTRQTRLRDRYATPQEGALPKAYER
jgi:imidazolonepropionase-like amidohydrolase